VVMDGRSYAKTLNPSWEGWYPDYLRL
jgi:hypothetical protein